jgi:hypothetical protein
MIVSDLMSWYTIMPVRGFAYHRSSGILVEGVVPNTQNCRKNRGFRRLAIIGELGGIQCDYTVIHPDL